MSSFSSSRPSKPLKNARSLSWAACLCLVGALALTGCAQEEEAAAPPRGERVENAELGMAVAEVPSFFKLVSNQGTVIELAPASEEVEGVLKIQESAAETGGINLVAAIERQKADFEGRENGEFKGQRELGTQLGTAFYARGLYTEAGRNMEEVIIFMVHPKGDRELQMVYTYPAAEDSKERLTDQLFSVLGELEALAPALEDAGAAEDGASAAEAG